MKKIFITAFKITVTLGLLAWLLASIDLNRLGTVLTEASLLGLAILIALCFGNKCLAAYRWHWLLRCNGTRPPFRDVLRWSLVGGAVSAALPFGAAGTEVARVATAARERWRIGRLASAAVLDRLIGIITLALIVVLGTHLSTVPVPGIQTLAIAVIAAAGLVIIAVARRWDTPFIAILPQRLRRPLLKPLDSVHAAIYAFRRKRWALAYAFLITVGFQFVRVFGAYVGGLALGIDVPFGFIVATFPLVMFANMLPISLNGIGVREMSLTYALSIAGIGAEQAIALGLTLSALNLLANLPGVVLLLKPAPKSRRARTQAQPLRRIACQAARSARTRLADSAARNTVSESQAAQQPNDRTQHTVAPRAGALRR